MKTFIAITLLVLSTNAAANQDQAYFKQVLTAAKVASACATINQIELFQNAARIPGGDFFVKNFMLSEQARWGVTDAEYWALCVRAVAIKQKAYNTLVGPE